MNHKKKILVAPLHWGLGHATRCIPVIRELLIQDAEVMIASDGAALELLQMEFPALKWFLLPSYNIRYSPGVLMPLRLLFQTPSILNTISKEHEALQKLIDAHHFDAVISDNRYGLWNKNVKSVFITHQLFVRPPAIFGWARSFVQSAILKKINRFDECWVPDSEGDVNLSGELSHGIQPPFKTIFVGPLSRLSAVADHPTEKKYDLLIILSGPEPQRTLLEKLMMEQIKGNNSRILLIRGTDITDKTKKTEGNLTIVNHLPATEMQQALLSSETIICRSGYSSIMDLAALGKKAILIPTPGQTEQEYLASYLKQKNIFFSMSQRDFNLETALKESANYPGIKFPATRSFSHVVESLLV